MRTPFSDSVGGAQMHLWMNIALYGSLVAGFFATFYYLLTQQTFGVVQTSASLISILLLALFIALRHFHQARLDRHRHTSKRQSEALRSLLEVVMHELNNDMQVVVGNAELAEMLMASGKDVKKPVSNIAMAASSAISHLNQLSVCHANRQASKVGYDLNALLTQSAAQLNDQQLPNAKFQLELEQPPQRIFVDRDLFTLNLRQLILRAVHHMEFEYEIVFRTAQLQDRRSSDGRVSANILFQPIDIKSNPPRKNRTAEVDQSINLLMSNSAALFGLSGGLDVRHECTDHGDQLSMVFDIVSV